MMVINGNSWSFIPMVNNGVYKLGVTQLIDSGIVGKELNDWINNNLPNIPVPSKGNEEYESWYNRFAKYKSRGETRIIEAPVSQRNNALYYMLLSYC